MDSQLPGGSLPNLFLWLEVKVVTLAAISVSVSV